MTHKAPTTDHGFVLLRPDGDREGDSFFEIHLGNHFEFGVGQDLLGLEKPGIDRFGFQFAEHFQNHIFVRRPDSANPNLLSVFQSCDFIVCGRIHFISFPHAPDILRVEKFQG